MKLRPVWNAISDVVGVIGKMCLVATLSTGSTSAAAPSTLSSKTQTPEVFVLGTVHIDHLSPTMAYSFQDLIDIVTTINPDLICAEVYDRDYGTDMEGYYPPENPVIEFAAESIGAEFFPSDWRGSKYEDEAAYKAMTDEERQRFDALPKAHKELPADPKERLEYIHAAETQKLIRESHEIRIAAGTEVADGWWYSRNQIIVKKCMRKAQKVGAQKILFTFGADHKYIIEENVQKYYFIEASKIPIPSVRNNNEMPSKIIDHWRRNLRGLRKVRNGDRGSKEFRHMVRESGRIEDLKSCIKYDGLANPNVKGKL
ncbi:MAG: hypothetical protein AB7T49_14245 [Oligoflexales bacterium]